jgi:hypothetical protein
MGARTAAGTRAAPESKWTLTTRLDAHGNWGQNLSNGLAPAAAFPALGFRDPVKEGV